jgi:hypothetical protein
MFSFNIRCDSLLKVEHRPLVCIARGIHTVKSQGGDTAVEEEDGVKFRKKGRKRVGLILMPTKTTPRISHLLPS